MLPIKWSFEGPQLLDALGPQDTAMTIVLAQMKRAGSSSDEEGDESGQEN